MIPLPSLRRFTAALLLVLVVFNGVLCSVGHGRMMGVTPHPMQMGGAEHSAHEGMHRVDEKPLPAHQMSPTWTECFFAGSLPCLLFAVLVAGWLLAAGLQRPCLPAAPPLPPPRGWLPRINPQAP